MDCAEGFVAADCRCRCVSSVLLLLSCARRRRRMMLTGGGYEAVEVSHRRVVDERVGDHGCGVLVLRWDGMVGGVRSGSVERARGVADMMDRLRHVIDN